jgi:acetate kinase
VLTLNGGSSSIRFAIYPCASEELRLAGKIDRIGTAHATLTVDARSGSRQRRRSIPGTDHHAAAGFLVDWLEAQPVFSSVRAVGHRIVHGFRHPEPQRITPRLLAELRRNTVFAPDHLPGEIRLIETFARRQPTVPQVACFDSAFHRSMPAVARRLPIPRRYAVAGIERYGFHGLSYAFLMGELARLDPAAAKGRVILAHLGSGASLAAVLHSKSVDTSMGFTPASGLVMGTRTGDIDPGLAYYFARGERMTARRFQKMVNHESGLLGVSATSSDIRDLLGREHRDARAAEAVALFCYQVKKWIGAFAAALGGVDTLVFAGGIGENAPVIRERICDGLDFLGITVHRTRNARNAPLISTDRSTAAVRVIRTNEELMIARSVIRVLTLAPPTGNA